MASGDTLAVFTPHAHEPPSTNFAYFDVRNSQLLLVFDAATAWSTTFSGILPRQYGGGGLTIGLVWVADTATSGNVKWNAQFERHQAGTDSAYSDSFAAAQTATDAAPATAGLFKYTNIVFTSGQIDSLAVGESFRFKITRDAADAADTMIGYAYVMRVELRET